MLRLDPDAAFFAMKNPAASILTIGDELLKGSTLNTNAQFLGRELSGLGFCVKDQQSCRDSIQEIRTKLRAMFPVSELLMVSGGLGPTPDDRTRDAVAEFLGVPLIFSKSQFALIRKLYRQKKRRVPALVRQEALFPKQAIPLINRYGIALGFSVTARGRVLIALPGVPSELEKMFRAEVRPLLVRHFRELSTRPALTVRLVGISEPDVMRKLGRDFFKEVFDFGIYPDFGEVALRIQADQKQTVARARKKIKARLSRFLYAEGDFSLAAAVGKLLLRKNKTIAVAESCTGGLLASEITTNPGASRYFLGALTAYSNRIKESWLGVSHTVLAEKGAVSHETARALAASIRENMQASYGLAVTGIAGPGGGSPRKPVGLVYIALASASRIRVWKENFWGNRLQVQRKAVKKALEYLFRELVSC